MLTGFCLFLSTLIIEAQTPGAKRPAAAFDRPKAEKILKDLDNKFTDEFRNGDSVALAAHYAKDGSFGVVKKEKILCRFGEA